MVYATLPLQCEPSIEAGAQFKIPSLVAVSPA
jgi:hypothetical protein